MSIDDVIFIDSFPKIDLHGYDRDSARVAIEDFILDNIQMKNEIIVIVHGIGTGIIRNITHKTLSKNKHVIEFKSANMNRGCTIVSLKIDKTK